MMNMLWKNSLSDARHEQSVIICYTSTGNSLQVALALKERLGGDVVSAADLTRGDCRLEHDGIVGIVCPVHFYGLPVTIVDLLSRISFINGTPEIFLVLTCGTFTSRADSEAERLLGSRNLKLDYVFSVKMPENYTPLFRVPPQDKIDELLSGVDGKAEEIASIIRKRSRGNHNSNKGPGFMTGIARGYFIRGRKTSKFRLNSKCTGCGLCARICPADAIEIKDGRAAWVKDRCDLCLACLHRCPFWAIERGRLTRRKRYVNPVLDESR